MKKLLLIALTSTVAMNASAQVLEKTNAPLTPATGERAILTPATDINGNFKTTGLSNPLNYFNNASTQLFDTSAVYRYDLFLPVDSGYFFGYNVLGTKAYAEKFDFDFMPDTTFQIIGMTSLWAGTVSPATTKTIDIKIWRQGAQQPVSGFPNRYYEGFPDSVKKSQTVSIKTLGIGNASPDTIKTMYFTTPLTGVDYNFYIGYEANYSWGNLAGDTITLRSTRNSFGLRNLSYRVSGGDTILLNRGVMQASNNSWVDLGFNLGLDLNLSIVPIVQMSSSNITGVGGLKKDELTFYGHYPNPAVDNINIKFSLEKAADVTVQLADMNGRIISTVNHAKMTAGEHVLPVETSALAAGNYIYLLRTSNGAAIASKLTIIR